MNGADDFEDKALGADGKLGDDELGTSEDFDDLIGLLREGPIDLTDDTPSPSVWAGISSELGLVADGGLQASPVTPLDPAATAGASVVPPVASGASASIEGSGSNVVSLASRRPAWGRPAAILTLAAAVVLLLAVPVALSLRSGSDVDLIASAQLELLEGQSGSAVAAELVSVDGDLAIDVEAPTEVADGEFLELWLLEVDEDGVQSLESLGRVDGSGRYDVPDDVDLDRFRVVDISVELDDGNPDHSGNSVVRGELA